MFVSARGENFGFAKEIGIGLVESAINLAAIALKDSPKSLIFIGSAGSYDPSVGIFEIFTSTCATQIEISLIKGESYTPMENKIEIVSQETIWREARENWALRGDICCESLGQKRPAPTQKSQKNPKNRHALRCESPQNHQDSHRESMACESALFEFVPPKSNSGESPRRESAPPETSPPKSQPPQAIVNSSNYITTDTNAAAAMKKAGILLENMEFFSVLSVAKHFGIPALGIFCVTNYCDQNAHEAFLKNAKTAHERLESYAKSHFLL